MIPILDFCWHEFTAGAASNVSVGSLYKMAQQQTDLFVLHDTEHRSSAVVIPETVTYAVEALSLPLQESAAATGLLDMLGQDQITIHMSQPASLASRLAHSCNAQAIIAVNDADSPVGLFIPSVVSERLPWTSQIAQGSTQNLRQAVRELLGTNNLAGAIEAIEKAHGGFQSKRLNIHAPDPYVCDDHGRPHIWSHCPCERHPGANCRRR